MTQVRCSSCTLAVPAHALVDEMWSDDDEEEATDDVLNQVCVYCSQRVSSMRRCSTRSVSTLRLSSSTRLRAAVLLLRCVSLYKHEFSV